MAKQTAVEWLVEMIKQNVHNSFEEFELLVNKAKEMEKQQAHEYAEFAIRCDRKEMKILNFDGFINLKSE